MVVLSPVRPADLVQAAYALYCAGRAAEPIDPLTGSFPELTVEDAYAVQRHNRNRALVAGRRLTGYKVGLARTSWTSAPDPAAPDGAGLEQVGYLLDDMAVPDGAVLSLAGMVRPHLQTKFALHLAEDLPSPEPTLGELVAACDAAAPAFDIVDSRVRAAGVVDEIADNASAGRYVVGPLRALAGPVDLTGPSTTVSRNDTLIAAVGADPRTGWRYRRLTHLADPIGAGELVLVGALHPGVPLCPGERWRAEVPGFGAVCLTTS